MITWQPGKTIADMEKEIILYAYRFYERNQTRTASALGVSVRTIANKLDEYSGTQETVEVKSVDDVESSPKLSAKPTVPVRQSEKIQAVSSK